MASSKSKLTARGGVTISIVYDGEPGADAVSIDCPSALQVAQGKPLQRFRISARVGNRVLRPIASTSNGLEPATSPTAGRFAVVWAPSSNLKYGKFLAETSQAVVDYGTQEEEYIAEAQAEDGVALARIRIYVESLSNYVEREISYTLVEDGAPGLPALSLSLQSVGNVSNGTLPNGFTVQGLLTDANGQPQYMSISEITWRVSDPQGQMVAPPADLFAEQMAAGIGPQIVFSRPGGGGMEGLPVFMLDRESISYSLSVKHRDGRRASASLTIPLAKPGIQGDTGPMTAIPTEWSGTATYYAGAKYKSVVYIGSEAYMCKKTHTNKRPPNSTYWEPIGGVDVLAIINAFVVNLFANNAFIKNLKATGIDTCNEYNKDGVTIDKVVKFYNQNGHLVREYGYDRNGEVLDRFFDKHGVLRMEYNPTEARWDNFTGPHSYTPYWLQQVAQPAGTDMEPIQMIGRPSKWYKFMTYTSAYMQHNGCFYSTVGGSNPAGLTRLPDGWYVDPNDTASNPGGPTWLAWTRYTAIRYADGKQTDDWYYVYQIGLIGRT